MKRLACLLSVCVALLCAGSNAYAQQGGDALFTGSFLEGEIAYPASGAAAIYTLRYTLPQMDGNGETADAINTYYRTWEKELQKTVVAHGQELAACNETSQADLSFQATYIDERYASFVLTTLTSAGSGEWVSLGADTFALDGLYAGSRISLSQLLGLEEATEGETSLASALAYEVVWQIIQQEAQNADGDYLDGLTLQSVRNALNPETDFYLDADGNVVFFIQPGEVAGEIAGVLFYPFSIAELLSAL